MRKGLWHNFPKLTTLLNIRQYMGIYSKTSWKVNQLNSILTPHSITGPFVYARCLSCPRSVRIPRQNKYVVTKQSNKRNGKGHIRAAPQTTLLCHTPGSKHTEHKRNACTHLRPLLPQLLLLPHRLHSTAKATKAAQKRKHKQSINQSNTVSFTQQNYANARLWPSSSSSRLCQKRVIEEARTRWMMLS